MCRKSAHSSKPDHRQMPRRFFRKFAFKRHQLSEQWFMTPFRHLLHDHRLWGIRRRTVVPAFALGLFIAFMPFPGHTLTGALLALAFRVNIPVAALATWVSNPVTMVRCTTSPTSLGVACWTRHCGTFSSSCHGTGLRIPSSRSGSRCCWAASFWGLAAPLSAMCPGLSVALVYCRLQDAQTKDRRDREA